MTNETEYQRGYREGAENMREEVAIFVWDELYPNLATKIRALPITPQPAAQGEDEHYICQVKMGFPTEFGREFFAADIALPNGWLLSEHYFTPIADILIFETDDGHFPTRQEAFEVQKIIRNFDAEWMEKSK